MKQVEIKLLGRDFTIACPEEEEANLQKSINYLANKIDEVQKTGNIIGVDKTIIMRKAKQSLNEELNRMKKLINFDISENSHDVLSEQFISEQKTTHIGTKRKGLDIVWGKGKTITLRKGKKNSSKELSQGETKPTKPEEGWDDFLKGDQKMVGLMSGNSKKYWETLKNSDNGIEKGFAVAALEEFIKTVKPLKDSPVS